MPYNPKIGNSASVDRPNTFSDFDSAVAVMKNYDGIGIRVASHLVAIDLDNCIDDGKLSSWSEKIVSHFKNTYIETGPSGTGLHIFLFVAYDYVYDKDTTTLKRRHRSLCIRCYRSLYHHY